MGGSFVELIMISKYPWLTSHTKVGPVDSDIWSLMVDKASPLLRF